MLAGSRCPVRAVPHRCAARRLRVMCQVTTPHSGYHFDGTPRRFFEGWYWKVMIPETGQSFALIYSIEDPLGNTAQAGVGLQVRGQRGAEGR
ncbi:Tocopherol cyclase, chloroplastic [Tetrabaena socialis]|uniref:Tocopherol cyclase, chloroplastic n=1 Tax=Tetrabaena socialis TaxID=47790 RepID=A0A2J8AAA1_9CHLO|nr:Tocopherol cyclase, chloroplastic [Tetrabaena socialis]|eukprot:PNH09448.1 Tocopherol cyclase, chloroplastic [Tetrabaena socialis]